MVPIDALRERRIGHIESVAPDGLTVKLEESSPHSVVLSTGAPRPFPRINGYLLVPVEGGALVGIITWLGIVPASKLKEQDERAQRVVHLPYGERKLSLAPVGTLVSRERGRGKPEIHELLRGVVVFPSVGDVVLVPSSEELSSIIERTGVDRRLFLGEAPLAGGARVSVDPDKLFGRHLAVLGNTGSGKSCSVAGLIRWSLNAAKEVVTAREGDDQNVNARFIILDPNGEYAHAFRDFTDRGLCRTLTLSSRDATGLSLVAPHWAWTVEEWTGILRTGPGFQTPVLRMALQSIKDWSAISVRMPGHRVVRIVATFQRWLDWLIEHGGPRQYATFPGTRNVSEMLGAAVTWLEGNYRPEDAPAGLGSVKDLCARMEETRASSLNGTYQNPYDVNKLEELRAQIRETLGAHAEGVPHVEGSPDRPRPFSIADLAATVEILSERLGDSAGYTHSMLLRLRRFDEDADICSAIDSHAEETLETILRRTFGAQSTDGSSANIVILDLSFVPRDVLHIVISVLGRMVFETLQWYRELDTDGKVLPTVVVLEEAHTFVQRRSDWREEQLEPASMCRATFERIAREGRKYGLGLVLSSQRPSEISATVLAQCNTFLLHRLVNDRDQELVGRLVPDSMSGLLQDLSNLPTQQAILLGWATPIPVLLDVRYLPEELRPHSEDPDFWKVWTGEVERGVDWEKIAEEWQGGVAPPESSGKAE